jgi:hypothetical protein
MNREAIGRSVVRLYPENIRQNTGGELVGTLLDAGDVSASAYLRQLISLVRSGLWARAKVELARPLGQTVLTAVCWVAVLDAMNGLVTTVGVGLRWGGSAGSSPDSIAYGYVLPVLILVLFTLRKNRIVGVLGLVWLAIYVDQHQQMATVTFLKMMPVQAAGFVLLIARPDKPLPAGRFLWPIPALVLLIYQVTLLGQLSGVGQVTPVLATLVLLPWAPALALGMALDGGLSAIYYLNLHHIVGNDPHLLVEAAEFAAGIPIVILALTIARRTTRSTHA